MRARSRNHSQPITIELVRQILRYEPDTGNFYWLQPRSNAIAIGSIAGTRAGHGYWQISINDRLYRAHRLAWFYVHGVWPTNVLDHVNGDKLDNSILNLRDVSHSANSKFYCALRDYWKQAPAFHC
jgi:hypothetical protein